MKPGSDAGAAMLRAVQERHPRFKVAVLADLALARRQRGDLRKLTSRSALAFELPAPRYPDRSAPRAPRRDRVGTAVGR
jgi:hypothetical protein